MNNELKQSAVSEIKEEFCSRYGLKPEDVQISVTLWNLPTVEAVDQVIEDYSINEEIVIHKGKGNYIPGTEEYAKSVTFSRSNDPHNLLSGITAYSKEGVLK